MTKNNTETIQLTVHCPIVKQSTQNCGVQGLVTTEQWTRELWLNAHIYLVAVHQ
jgi:hypothetical protein